MPYDGKLGAGKAVFNIRFDQVGDQGKGLGGDPGFFDASFDHLGIGNVDLDRLFQVRRKNAGDLDGIGPVLCKVRYIDRKHGSPGKALYTDRSFIDIESEALHSSVCLYIEHALSVVSQEAVHGIHGQGIVRIALPVRKDGLSLPFFV